MLWYMWHKKRTSLQATPCRPNTANAWPPEWIFSVTRILGPIRFGPRWLWIELMAGDLRLNTSDLGARPKLSPHPKLPERFQKLFTKLLHLELSKPVNGMELQRTLRLFDAQLFE